MRRAPAGRPFIRSCLGMLICCAGKKVGLPRRSTRWVTGHKQRVSNTAVKSSSVGACSTEAKSIHSDHYSLEGSANRLSQEPGSMPPCTSQRSCTVVLVFLFRVHATANVRDLGDGNMQRWAVKMHGSPNYSFRVPLVSAPVECCRRYLIWNFREAAANLAVSTSFPLAYGS
jgi:hypothetical protein